MFYRKNSSIKKWWILKKNLSLWFLEENVTFVVWKKVVLLTWLYVSKVTFWNWKQDFIFVWDKIFYHTSLMKMWHFYLLEKRDVLLQKRRSYFERTFSFQFNEITYQQKWTIFFEKIFITDFWRKCEVFDLKRDYILDLTKVIFLIKTSWYFSVLFSTRQKSNQNSTSL